jgi:hypothetical protein
MKIVSRFEFPVCTISTRSAGDTLKYLPVFSPCFDWVRTNPLKSKKEVKTISIIAFPHSQKKNTTGRIQTQTRA